MKIKAESYGTLVLEEVFNPISLISQEKEKLCIVMRDSGFEVSYKDKKDSEVHRYEFKNGIVNNISTNLKNKHWLFYCTNKVELPTTCKMKVYIDDINRESAIAQFERMYHDYLQWWETEEIYTYANKCTI